MYIRLGGRKNGKSYQLLCEQISELQLKIEFAKKFGLSYKEEEQYLNSLYKKLNGGKNVEKEESNTDRKATNKKNKNPKGRLF